MTDQAMTPSESRPVVVIGAGPHGLSATAHLRGAGVPTRPFGTPMSFWRETMPAGMLLRSSIRASSIDDPGRRRTIGDWSQAAGRELTNPIPVGDFIDYGLWFQEQVAPDLDQRTVASVRKDGCEFRVVLTDGEEITASRVVVAAGLAPFVHVPPSSASCRSPRSPMPATPLTWPASRGSVCSLSAAARAPLRVPLCSTRPARTWRCSSGRARSSGSDPAGRRATRARPLCP